MPIEKPTIEVPAKLAPTPFMQANSSMIERPFFSFQYICRPRHINELEQAQQAELIKQLCILSEKTWQEIRAAPRHGIGCEQIHQKLTFDLPQTLKGQTILAFRYSGKLAMVGFRDKNVFHILGVDRDFKTNSCYEHPGS
jgi:hypothetical protein